MKKLFIVIILFFISVGHVCASDKIEVTLNKCVDGDTAWFIKDGQKIKARFLAIDTPESTNEIEKYGKEASEYTCNLLEKAEIIEIEYDSNSDEMDKYERHLVWVFVDGQLLQEKVISNGLAEVAYLYGDYKYTDTLKTIQEKAKSKQLGIWSDDTNEENNFYFYIAIAIVVLIIVCIFSKKIRSKVIRKTKNSIKKQLKKTYKKL